MTTKLRQRTRFLFWLNITPSDQYIAELIKWLKAQKTYTLAIREGLQLWASLREGRVDVLLSMFPFVGEALARLETAPAAGAGELQQIKAMLEIISKGQTTALAGNPKPLPRSNVALPVFDDEDGQDTLVIRKSTSTSSAMNFVNAMKNLDTEGDPAPVV